MQLLLKLKIDNLYKSKDFTDMKSGEVTKGKWKIQTFDEFDTAEGKQMKLVDISIPEKLALTFKDKVNQSVTIPVRTYVSNGRVGYYGLDVEVR